MDYQPEPVAAVAPPAERRASLRLAIPFPTVVLAFDRDGIPFCAAPRLEDLSTGGLSLRLPRPVVVGAELVVLIRFALDDADRAPAARVLVRGRACRVE